MKILSFDGHLAKDAEVKETSKGKKYINFRVGNTTYIKGENKTEWIDVTSFNPVDYEGKAQYLKKGRHVFVSGTFDSAINPGKDGRIYVNLSVLADRIDFISSGKKDDENNTSAPANSEPAISVEQPAPSADASVKESAPVSSEPTVTVQAEASDDDDLPF